jgi:hypothetical protein
MLIEITANGAVSWVIESSPILGSIQFGDSRNQTYTDIHVLNCIYDCQWCCTLNSCWDWSRSDPIQFDPILSHPIRSPSRARYYRLTSNSLSFIATG